MATYKKIEIPTHGAKDPQSKVLIIYTGGTFGMAYGPKGSLQPFDFGDIFEHFPTLKNIDIKISVISFPEPIDSSNVRIAHWNTMGDMIRENYEAYDGFVILHGTDTMAYSASALSFSLAGLNKPVIFTGAQLPIGAVRTDAWENLVTSLQIASAKKSDQPIVCEVCIYFNSFLYRGNRAVKVESSHFDAFASENYPFLAEAGITIDYNIAALRPYQLEAELRVHTYKKCNLTILKFFPSLNKSIVQSIFSTPGLQGVILETFGSGNAPTKPWLIEALIQAIENNIVLFNVSQCIGGRVLQGRYATSQHLKDIGVIGGSDITTEAALAKMMFLFSSYSSLSDIKSGIRSSICGEMTPME
ncbi:MAG: asparaginase [Cyclobacteriaceae bacterium]